MRRLSGVFLFFLTLMNMGAQQLFVPLDKDFVLFDLEQGKITYHFNYSQNPFGVRPVLSSDGRFIYFTKEYQQSIAIYRREVSSGQEVRFEMPRSFNSFRLINDYQVLLDEATMVNLGEKQLNSAALSQAGLFSLILDEKRPNTLTYNNEVFAIGDRQGQIIEAYFLVNEGLILYNMFFVNEKEPWQSYYQWFTFNPTTARSQVLDGLRGYARFNQGGAMVGARPSLSYVKKRA